MEKFRLKENHIEHMTSVNTVSISPDGSLCASGRKDGAVMLQGLSIKKPLYYTLETGSVVNARIFSPTRYWLCDTTDKITRFWDSQTKCIVDDLMPVSPLPTHPPLPIASRSPGVPTATASSRYTPTRLSVPGRSPNPATSKSLLL